MTASYQHYATHDESEYPHLWDGLRLALAPCLGPSGLRLHDHSGWANWGTLTNMDAATDWVVNEGQYALDFDGTNDYILIDHNAALNIPASSGLTISAWIYRTKNVAAYETVVTKRLSVGTFTNYELSLNNTSTGSAKAFGFYSGSSFTVSTTLVPLSEWTQVATVSSASGTTYYVNGRTAGTSATVVGTPNLHPFKIGGVAGSPETQFLSAIVDDVQIRNRPLFANEIAELYQIGRGGMYTPRRRRRAYSFGPSFLAALARGSNVIVQPCGVS